VVHFSPIPARTGVESSIAWHRKALSDQIAWIEKAAEDDKADAEERGDAERERQSWRPLRAA
jgi:hypothetical protein